MKTTTKRSALPAIGAPHAGGFFAGRFFDGTQAYALIVAPGAEGEQAKIAWNKTTKAVKGALSYSNGPANTAAMSKAGSALAKWARGLNIGGFDDWYIPSRLELLVAYGELRALNAFNPDQLDGFAHDWYWSSTQSAGYAAYAWCQGVGNGSQNGTHKDDELRARAVRRLPI
jgi:hypothetical protein